MNEEVSADRLREYKDAFILYDTDEDGLIDMHSVEQVLLCLGFFSKKSRSRGFFR